MSRTWVLLATCAASLPSVKHVVLVVVDDLGWNDWGARNAAVRTPTLDALAANGTVLSNYYTHEVCSPTRGAILTGRLAYRLGYQGVIGSSQETGVPASLPMLPEVLKRAFPALRAHCVGKWHTGLFRTDLLPTARGFDTFFGYLDGAESYTSHGNTMGFCAAATNATNATTPPFARDLWTGTSPAPPSWDGVYSTEMYSAQLARLVAQHDAAAGPLFLYAAFQNVHEPIGAPARFERLYANQTNSSSRATFMADVSALDEGVANLTRALRGAQLWEDTLLLVTSDNGANLHGGGNNWPSRGGKVSYQRCLPPLRPPPVLCRSRADLPSSFPPPFSFAPASQWSTWEGGIRSVAFAHAPGVRLHAQGGNATALMHACDLLPTILGAMGVPNASHFVEGIDGVDQWPLLSTGAPAAQQNGGPPPSPREIVHKMGQHTQGDGEFTATLRIGDLKLHVGFPGDDKGAKPCTGGCYCPLPDPRTGVRKCVNSTASSRGNPERGVQADPPSAVCAAACAAVSPSCAAAGSAKACVACLAPHSSALAAAGCRVPPGGKDLKHWCNGAVPSLPTPPPSPAPPPSLLPCVVTPCLYNITADPLETHDLAPSAPNTVAQMLGRARELQAGLVASPYPGGHNDQASCAALARTGMWGPWVNATRHTREV